MIIILLVNFLVTNWTLECKVYFLEELWCRVSGKDKHENLVSFLELKSFIWFSLVALLRE